MPRVVCNAVGAVKTIEQRKREDCKVAGCWGEGHHVMRIVCEPGAADDPCAERARHPQLQPMTDRCSTAVPASLGFLVPASADVALVATPGFGIQVCLTASSWPDHGGPGDEKSLENCLSDTSIVGYLAAPAFAAPCWAEGLTTHLHQSRAAWLELLHGWDPRQNNPFPYSS